MRARLLFSAIIAGGCAQSPGGGAMASTGEAKTTDDPFVTGETGSASSDGPATTSADATNSGDESSTGNAPDPALQDEAGFVELPPVEYTLDGTPYTSSRARLFWAFQPADDAVDDAPLFVFFNGGPGAGSGIFFGFNTARTTLDPNVVGAAGIVDNDSSWTTIGNCLWIDARLTGFGYGVMDDPSDATARIGQFDVANFNPMLDAADFVRVLLAFWDAHPSLRDDPVVLVGESYGGVRAAAIFDLVLFYAEHGDGTAQYQDPQLVDALQAHFDTTIAPSPGTLVEPDRVASQFGRQVLVQPLLAGEPQLEHAGDLLVADDSPVWALGDEIGDPFTPPPATWSGTQKRQYVLDFVRGAGRDTSNLHEAEGWTDSVITDVNTGLRTHDVLAQHLGLQPTSIPELFADARSGAYRVAAGPAPDHTSDLARTFGTLQPWDVYYMSFVSDVFDAFYGNDVYAHDLEPTSASLGRLALRTLLHVDTFVTHGTADVVVWPPAIAPAFATYPEVDWSIATDGTIRLQYVDGAFGYADAPYRELALRRYEDGAHTITMTHPAELLADVAAWLE